jgi:hypothetical protein
MSKAIVVNEGGRPMRCFPLLRLTPYASRLTSNYALPVL